MPTKKTPTSRTAKNKSRAGDMLFWLIVLILGVIAVVLVGMVLWDGWKTATAEPTEIFFSLGAAPDASSTPIPEAQLELSMDGNELLPLPDISPTLTELETTLSPEVEFTASPQTIDQPTEVVQNLTPDVKEDFQQELNAERLRDDFSTPLLGWSTAVLDASSRGYENSEYYIEVTVPSIYALSFVPSPFNPLVIKFDMRVASEPADGTFGILCQYIDDNSFYIVDVNPQTGQFSVGVRTNGIYASITDPEWQPLEGFETGVNLPNHFDISCQPEQISLIINGQQNTPIAVPEPLIGGSLSSVFVYGGQTLQPSGLRIYIDNFLAGAAVDSFIP